MIGKMRLNLSVKLWRSRWLGAPSMRAQMLRFVETASSTTAWSMKRTPVKRANVLIVDDQPENLIALRDRRETVIARLTDAFAADLYDVEEFVSEYSASAGDAYLVKELEKFGIRPLEFSVVKRAEAEPGAVAARFRQMRPHRTVRPGAGSTR